MLLNKVVVGKGYKILHDNPSMTAPPAGFDSVSRATLSFGHSKAELTMGYIRSLPRLAEVSTMTN